MKKPLLSFAIFFLIFQAHGQYTFEKTFGTENNDVGRAVTKTFDGGYLLATEYNDSEHKVIKTNNKGDIIWSKTYPFLDSNAGGFRSVIQTQDSNYVLLCWKTTVLKINSIGDTLWLKKYESGSVSYSKIAEDHAGNLIVVGAKPHPNPDYCCLPVLRKFNSSGNIISNFTPYITCASDFGCGLSEIFIDNEGNYLVSGIALSNSAVPVPGLTKIDTGGNVLWNNYYPITFATIEGITQESDSSYLLVGINWNFNDSTQLFKTDKNGNLLWWKKYKGNENGWHGRFIDNTNDGYFISGSDEDIYLMKIDLNYDFLWSKSFGGLSDERVNQMNATDDGGSVIIGYTESYGSGNKDIYFVKTNQDGLVVGLNEIESKKTPVIVAPNPFSTKTTIRIDEYLKNATLIVLNSFGQFIYQETGITGQEVVFSRNNIPAGIYYYILKQNSIIISTGKFLIIQD